MDPIIAKLIVSREKSCKVLEAEIAKLESLASASRNPAVQGSLISVANVKKQRLLRLSDELAGYRAADTQMVLPVDPTVRKPR